MKDVWSDTEPREGKTVTYTHDRNKKLWDFLPLLGVTVMADRELCKNACSMSHSMHVIKKKGSCGVWSDA